MKRRNESPQQASVCCTHIIIAFMIPTGYDDTCFRCDRKIKMAPAVFFGMYECTCKQLRKDMQQSFAARDMFKQAL